MSCPNNNDRAFVEALLVAVAGFVYHATGLGPGVLRFIEHYKNLPCMCDQLPADLNDEIICAACTARELELNADEAMLQIVSGAWEDEWDNEADAAYDDIEEGRA